MPSCPKIIPEESNVRHELMGSCISVVSPRVSAEVAHLLGSLLHGVSPQTHGSWAGHTAQPDARPALCTVGWAAGSGMTSPVWSLSWGFSPCPARPLESLSLQWSLQRHHWASLHDS